MAWFQILMLALEIIKLILGLFKKDPVLAKALNEEMREAMRAKDFPRLQRLKDLILSQ